MHSTSQQPLLQEGVHERKLVSSPVLTSTTAPRSHRTSLQPLELNDGDTMLDDGGSEGEEGGGEYIPVSGMRPTDPEAAFHKNASPLRWLMLALGVLMILGPYYAFDNPGGTQDALRVYFGSPLVITENSTQAESDAFGTFNENYQLLYSVYSFPNTILPLFGGVLVDLLGVRTMTVLCCAIAFGGQAVVILGISTTNWPLMWVGRAIFGVGTESLCVAQRILLAHWFIGKELALSNGVILALGRIGSVANDNISALYSPAHVQGAFCIGALICLISVAAAVAAISVDAVFESRFYRSAVNSRRGSSVQKLVHSAPHRKSRPCGSLGQVWRACVEIRSFGPLYVLLAILAVVGFPPVTTFNGVGAALLSTRAEAGGSPESTQTVEATLGIMYAVAAASAPFGGALVDKVGHRFAFLAASLAVMAGSHILFAVTAIPPAVMLSLLGLSFAVFASTLWTAITFVVPRTSLGLAYGLMGAIQNMGLAVAPLVVTALEPPACRGVFACVNWLFVGLAGLGCACAVFGAVAEAKQPPHADGIVAGGSGGKRGSGSTSKLLLGTSSSGGEWVALAHGGNTEVDSHLNLQTMLLVPAA